MTRPSRPVMGVSVKMDVGGTCSKRSDTGAPFSSFRDRLPIRGRGREAACAQVDDHHRHDLAAYEMAVENAPATKPTAHCASSTTSNRKTV